MNILFIGNSRLGDAILSTGVLDLFNKNNNRITIVCSSLSKEIYKGFTSVKKIIVIKKRKNSLHWIDVYKELDKLKWDVVVDLRNTIISRIIRKRKIYRYSRASMDKHLLLDLKNLLKSEKILIPKIYTTSEHKKRAKSFIKKISPKNKILAVAPVTNWKRKNWPLSRYKTLISNIIKNRKKYNISDIFILGSPAENYLCEQLKSKINYSKVYNIAGNNDILTTYELLKSCKIFIGNDSGLTHLAAATNNKTLALFGPSKNERYKPWGKNSFFIRTKESYAELVEHSKYNRFEESSLMGGLSVVKVLKKFDEVMK